MFDVYTNFVYALYKHLQIKSDCRDIKSCLEKADLLTQPVKLTQNCISNLIVKKK